MSEQKKDLIEQKVRETHRYFYDDGLVEIGIGFIFSLAGLVLSAWVLFEDNRGLRIASALALPVLATLGGLLVKRAVHAVKERVTYRRTGYVAYRHGEPSHGRSLIMLAALLLFIASFLLPQQLAKMSLMVGALLGLLLTFIGYRINLWRFYVVAAVALLTGLATAVFVPDELLGATISFVVIGLALLLGGGITFLNYMQEHPPTEEEIRV